MIFINILNFLAMLYLSLAWGPPSYDFNVLVMVPSVDATSSSTETQSPPKQSWQKSEELLAAVELARHSLSQLCLPFNLSLTELRTDCTSADLRIVRELTAADRTITVAVIGYFCKRLSHLLKITSPGRLGLVQIALNTHSEADYKTNYLYHEMLPSTRVYAEALTQFMTHVGWTRIAVAFTQTQNSYYFEMAEQVIRRLQDKGFEPFAVEISADELAVHREHILMTAIREIHTSGAKIIYVLRPPVETTQLICRAYDYGLRWPDYGWIVPDVSLEDVLSLNSSGNCDPNAVKGIFSIHMTNEANLSEVETMTYNNCPEEYAESATLEVLPSNIYASAIYDSILATALSLNQTFDEVQEYLAGQSSNSYTQSYKLEVQKRVSQMIGQHFIDVSFVGTLGEVTLNRSEVITETRIVIYQNNGDGSLKKLAEYNPHTNTTNFENYSTSRIPSDTLSRVYILIPLPLGAVLMTGIVLFSLLTLLNMILYIYYRNSPEMKATSVKLSMIIYLSSFAMYFGVCIDVYWSITVKVADHVRDIACVLVAWPVFLGGSTILATLLVKICRVHRIFQNLFEKVSFCSNYILFVIIILIVSVKVVCLAVWAAIDPFTIIDIEIYRPEGKPPYYEATQQCYSDHTYIWVSVLLGYAAILGAALAFMAFKTRKIKRKDFKDTKKINALMVSVFSLTAIITLMWGILRSTGNTNMSKILLAVLFMLLPASCQFYLFCPKTLPPLKRSLCKHFPNILKKEATCTH